MYPYDYRTHDPTDGGVIAVSATDAEALVRATRDVDNDPAAQALLNKINPTPGA